MEMHLEVTYKRSNFVIQILVSYVQSYCEIETLCKLSENTLVLTSGVTVCQRPFLSAFANWRKRNISAVMSVYLRPSVRIPLD
jgi:amino acid permease